MTNQRYELIEEKHPIDRKSYWYIWDNQEKKLVETCFEPGKMEVVRYTRISKPFGQQEVDRLNENDKKIKALIGVMFSE